MTTAGVDNIRELIAAASIRGVRLVETSAAVRFRDGDEIPDAAHLHLMQSARLGDVPEGRNMFFVLARVEATLVVPEQRNPDPLLSVHGEFELEYRLPEGFTATHEQLSMFAGVNGMFNAWPYMREYVQAITARMAIPPVTLPLFRMPRRVPAEPKQLAAGGEDHPRRPARKRRATKKSGGKR